jgi:superfamily II DNA or RNA helicase
MTDNNPVLGTIRVFCEKQGKKQLYRLLFPYNQALIDKIKILPKEEREYISEVKAWDLSTLALFSLISAFKKGDGYWFDFGSTEGREKFVVDLQKIKNLEEEKKKVIAEIEQRNKEAVEFKEYIEANTAEFVERIHARIKEPFKLYSFQVAGVMFLDKVKNALLAFEMGLGKEQNVDSKLLSHNGWIRMGDVKLGDKLIGSNGKPCNVIGVYPQGKKDIYRVWFNDYTYTDCGEEHLWAITKPTRLWYHSKKSINKKSPYKIRTLRQIMDEGLSWKNGNRKHYIPIVEPIEFEKKELLIHPYLLGCLLGDGTLVAKYGTQFTTSEPKLIDLLNGVMFSGNTLTKLKNQYQYSIKSNDSKINRFSRELKKLGLQGTNSYTKFIPYDYKFASIEQRLDVLKGLLDTDGHIFKDGSHIEITLASKQLIEDLQFIVQSLGGIGRIKDKWIIYKGEKRLYYRMGIKLPAQFIPFNLLRKIERYKSVSKYLPSRAIVKIEYIGKKDAQCIAVDAPNHLYVTDHCIVTHNTLSSIAYSEYSEFQKILVITPNSLKFNFYNEVEKFTFSKAHVVKWKSNFHSIEDSKYIIIHYDYFRDKDWNKVLTKFKLLGIGKIDAIVCDESQKLKNSAANTTKNFKKLVKLLNPKSKVFLSGTPTPNRAYELYTVLNEISPIEFSTKQQFYEYYCGMSFNRYTNQYETNVGAARFEELFRKTAPHIYRKRKIDVLDLPEKVYSKTLVEMSEKEFKNYELTEAGLANEIIGKEKLTSDMIITIMLRLRQFTSKIKLPIVEDLIESILEGGEKVVVLDMFKEPLYELKTTLGDIAAIHTGDQTVEERQEIVKKFQDPESNVKVFLGSIQTCNYGLTLTAASKMIIITLPYSVGEYDQATDRIHRIGTKNTVFIYPLIAKATIDELVFNKIESKRWEITKVIDNEEYESNVSESVLSEILTQLRSKYGR